MGEREHSDDWQTNSDNDILFGKYATKHLGSVSMP